MHIIDLIGCLFLWILVVHYCCSNCYYAHYLLEIKHNQSYFMKILGRQDQKTHGENMQLNLVPDLFVILVNNPKQPLHARHYQKLIYICCPIVWGGLKN